MPDTPRPRYTLRDLPLAAKLVVSAFLLAVGLGYFSAMVQLHIRHSDQQGSPLPSPGDVVKRFSKYQLYDPNEPLKCRIEEVVSGPRDSGWGASNMTPAFFSKSTAFDVELSSRTDKLMKVEGLEKAKAVKKAKDQLYAEREGERVALISFLNHKDDRRAMYETDAMPVPDALKGKPITSTYTGGGGAPKSKIEQLISGHHSDGWGAKNMTPAFFVKSSGYEKAIKRGKEKVDTARETERLAFLAFIHSPKDKRKAIYEADAMPLPAGLKDRPIDEEFAENGVAKLKTLIDARCVTCHKPGDQAPELDTFEKLEPYITAPPPQEPFVKVRSILNDRCGRCHNEGQSPQFPDFEKLEPLITAPKPDPIPSGGREWVLSNKTIDVSDLTQSTHAHLLSFAILFALTGLTYSFTSHPGFIRGVLGPVVLVAQVADVSCWWLARLELPYGPMFALTIMGTGGVVGLGLSLQILLSLFDMFGIKGKAVLVVLFLLAGGGFYVLYEAAIKPALDAEKNRSLLVEEVKEETAPQGQPQQPPPVQPQQPPARGNGGRVVPIDPPPGQGGGGGNKK